MERSPKYITLVGQFLCNKWNARSFVRSVASSRRGTLVRSLYDGTAYKLSINSDSDESDNIEAAYLSGPFTRDVVNAFVERTNIFQRQVYFLRSGRRTDPTSERT